MLRITIELVPRGNECLKRVIAVGEIANVTSLPGYTDEYVAIFKEDPFAGVEHGPYSCHVRNWPKSSKGTWELVHATLQQALKSDTCFGGKSAPATLRDAIDNWLDAEGDR